METGPPKLEKYARIDFEYEFIDLLPSDAQIFRDDCLCFGEQKQHGLTLYCLNPNLIPTGNIKSLLVERIM